MNSTQTRENESLPAQAQTGSGAGATDFSYTYSAKQNREIEQIRKKYLPPEENRLEQLHRLDKRAERPGTVAAIVMGSVSTLLLGIGMVLTMVYTRYFILGIVIGLAGIAGVSLAYPLYLRITRREREKIARSIVAIQNGRLDELEKNA